MKLTIEPTDRIVEVAGDKGVVPARVWQGYSNRGVPVTVLVTRVAVERTHDQAAFQRALEEQTVVPSRESVEAWPMRVVL